MYSQMMGKEQPLTPVIAESVGDYVDGSYTPISIPLRAITRSFLEWFPCPRSYFLGAIENITSS